MQSVSTAWKSAQEQTLVPESYVEVVLNVGEPAAQESAVTTDNGHIFLSNTPQLADETTKEAIKYGTLETDIWILDGSIEIVPDNPPYGNGGYIGNALSDESNEYTPLPIITITFPQVFTQIIPGMMIYWGTAYDEYAAKFRITVYNGEAVEKTINVTDNTDVTCIIEEDIQNYDKIVLEVLEWCRSDRRARIESIVVGIKRVYDKSKLMDYSHSMEVDPLSSSLPITEITFEIENLNGEYNPDNPQGAEKYLIERQAVIVRYGYKLNGEVEWIKAGTFYLNEWETPQNGITATFSARDLLEFMSDNYSGTNSGTLEAIATSALTQANLPMSSVSGNRWTLDSSLSSISAPSGVDLSGYTIAEVLQLVANAACCVLYQDRDGILHIEPLPDGETDYEIKQFNSYANSEISLTKQLKAVDVNDGTAVVTVGTVGETQKISNPLISSSRAQTVAQWAANYLQNRKILSGDYRADPRLDALDRVTTINQFAESTVLVTNVNYTYNGAFRGSYEGRANV